MIDPVNPIITLRIKNFDETFQNTTTEKVFINYEDGFDNETKERLDNIILRVYSEDHLSVIPACSCGTTKGAYYVGETASCCGTFVSSSIDDTVSFLLWLKQPQEVERFISPMIMINLLARYKITKPSVRLVEYIMQPNYRIDRKQPRKNIAQLDKLDLLLANHGIKRGYNSFVQNFYQIIQLLEDEFVKKKPSKQTNSDNFMKFLKENEANIFSHYLPFPNRVIFTMESNELGKYLDKSLLSPINVIHRLTGIDLYTRTSKVKQSKVASSLVDLADFYLGYLQTVIFKKEGLIRQQISSSRSHFTARAVITSIYGPHKYDDLYIPWSVACSLLREHILNRLYLKGYTFKTAVAFLQYHNRKYHPLLDEIFLEILTAGSDESGFGLPAMFNRNPSLHRGSIQRVRISKIKTDVEDTTFSISPMQAPAFNGDFDGRPHCRQVNKLP